MHHCITISAIGAEPRGPEYHPLVEIPGGNGHLPKLVLFFPSALYYKMNRCRLLFDTIEELCRELMLYMFTDHDISIRYISQWLAP